VYERGKRNQIKYKEEEKIGGLVVVSLHFQKGKKLLGKTSWSKN